MPNPSAILTDVSRQIAFPGTVSRFTLAYKSWQQIYGRYGLLTTKQMRKLGNWGLPGAAKATLIHQMTGLKWEILNDEGEEDENTEFYTALLDNVNDGEGFRTFLNKWADDILTAQEGGLFEIVRTDRGDNAGVPVALYNMDARTVVWTGEKKEPWVQNDPFVTAQKVSFRDDQIGHSTWYPFAEIEAPKLSRSPIQLAYIAIAILADGDNYNKRLLNEVIPQGILNLGAGFDEQKAMKWRAAWNDARMAGGRLKDIGLLWGTDKVGFTRFETPPKDMGFENLEHWYATVVAAAFEMTIFDLGIMTKVSTKAAAESQEKVSKRQGLKHLMALVTEELEFKILPEGYEFKFEDVDPADELGEAKVVRERAIAMRFMMDAMGPEGGLKEAARAGLLTPETTEEVMSGTFQFGAAPGMTGGEGVAGAAGAGERTDEKQQIIGLLGGGQASKAIRHLRGTIHDHDQLTHGSWAWGQRVVIPGIGAVTTKRMADLREWSEAQQVPMPGGHVYLLGAESTGYAAFRAGRKRELSKAEIERMSEWTRGVPNEFFENLRVRVIPERLLNEAEKGYKGWYSPGMQMMSLVDRKGVENGYVRMTFLHELGHHVATRLFGHPDVGTSGVFAGEGEGLLPVFNAFGTMFDKYNRSIDLSQLMSLYSMKDSGEFFAESFERYIRAPSILRARQPDTYEWFRDNIFKGIEYLGRGGAGELREEGLA